MAIVHDPRVDDLPLDHELWERALSIAWEKAGRSYTFGNVYWILHGFRALGAELVEGETMLRLRRGEIDADEYALDREQYLEPNTELIRRILEQAKAELAADREGDTR